MPARKDETLRWLERETGAFRWGAQPVESDQPDDGRNRRTIFRKKNQHPTDQVFGVVVRRDQVPLANNQIVHDFLDLLTEGVLPSAEYEMYEHSSGGNVRCQGAPQLIDFYVGRDDFSWPPYHRAGWCGFFQVECLKTDREKVRTKFKMAVLNNAKNETHTTEIPNSANLTVPLESMRTFEGLRFPWIMGGFCTCR